MRQIGVDAVDNAMTLQEHPAIMEPVNSSVLFYSGSPVTAVIALITALLLLGLSPGECGRLTG